MDQKELREWEARCIQEEPPACRAGCPLGVDARAFVLAMGRDNPRAAWAVLEKSMPLAGITARLCEAPCEKFCLRKDLGGPLAIGLLERSCAARCDTRAKILRLPARPKKAAVIGSGPSGLAVAFDLAKKGYPVTVYHLDTAPGGWLRDLPDEILPARVLDEEIRILESLRVSFASAESLDLALIEAHPADAVYIGQDDRIDPALLTALGKADARTMALEKPGWFTGGAVPCEFRFIGALSHGREAATSMDRHLQGASLTASRVFPRFGHTDLFTNLQGIRPEPRIVPAQPGGYAPQEATQEASRCIDCQCLECVRHCVYLREYGAYPKNYARRVFNNSAIVQGARQANKFINSCSLCGQCEVLCPNGFSMADMCLDARRQMVREKRMPPSAHWFALEEMRSARSEGALLAHGPEQDKSAVLFFPGCQLAGIRPDQTARLYERLLELEPATGVWLDCCGAPAHWSGRTGEFSGLCDDLRRLWEQSGRPRILAACSTCLKMFRDHLPGLEVLSVWAFLAEHPMKGAAAPSPPLALSDPCTARHDGPTRAAVRTLLEKAGQPLAPLPMSGELTECCGFGGLMDSANPDLARKTAEARAAQSDACFLTYCAMCRDQLARIGKPVLHMLDVLFPDAAHPAGESPAGISTRRANRRRLKNDLLSGCGRPPAPAAPWEGLPLLISGPVAELLEKRRILEDDLRRVLFQAKESGEYFTHGEDGREVASARLGEVTFWVEYRPLDSGSEILNAWSHRMRIGKEDA